MVIKRRSNFLSYIYLLIYYHLFIILHLLSFIYIVIDKYSSLSLAQRIQNFEREMVARSSPKVQASHKANSLLHSPEVLSIEYGFEGVDSKLSKELLEEIEKREINANLSENLESVVIEIFHQIIKEKESG